MPTISIQKKTTSKGEPRFIVRFRLGGRAYPLVHAGSFKTMREARARRDFIAGELGAGRNPAETLQAVLAPKPKRTAAGAYQSWRASRLDLDERTLQNIDFHWKRLKPVFGDLALDEVTFQHVQQWIADNGQGEGKLTPKVLRDYTGTLKQMLDFAGIDPNPARDRRIRYPTAEQQIPVPPTDRHVLALLEQLPQERRLFFAFLEQDGGRLGEHIAFTWATLTSTAGGSSPGLRPLRAVADGARPAGSRSPAS